MLKRNPYQGALNNYLGQLATRIVPTESDEERAQYDWRAHARPEQLPPPGNWTTWIFLAGRGAGKSRSMMEWVCECVEKGEAKRIALVAPTAAAARDVLIEGPSGLLNVCPPWCKPTYSPSKRRVTWPNGAIATHYSGDEPDRARGPQHDLAIFDEFCYFTYPAETLSNILFGLRMGKNPRLGISTTPKPMKELIDLINQPTTVVTRGSTYDNIDNLAPTFRDQVIARYEGTRLGRQELYAEILEDVEGALWKREWIDATRIHNPADVPDLVRVAVGVDPMGSVRSAEAECGIVVGGVGRNGDGYLLADYSIHGTPEQWGSVVVSAYQQHKADHVVVERNFGGDMVLSMLRAIEETLPVKEVVAARGKIVRAEPVAALSEQGKLHHVGNFPQLEEELCRFVIGDPSPNRLDAYAWLWHDLMLGGQRGMPIVEL